MFILSGKVLGFSLRSQIHQLALVGFMLSNYSWSVCTKTMGLGSHGCIL